MDIIQDILNKCDVKGNVIMLPEISLDRKLYMQVAKKIEGIGGKWNKKHKGFLFEYDPSELIGRVKNGESINLKKEFQFFATPDDVADYLVELAGLSKDHTVLEPSAGDGAIIKAIHRSGIKSNISCFELNQLMHPKLLLLPNISFLGSDFIKDYVPINVRFDRIIANPPFSKNQDIDHIYKMYECLKRGGRLVSIASKHWMQSNNKKESAFRDFLSLNDAATYSLERGRFKESGTLVETVVIVIDKL